MCGAQCWYPYPPTVGRIEREPASTIPGTLTETLAGTTAWRCPPHRAIQLHMSLSCTHPDHRGHTRTSIGRDNYRRARTVCQCKNPATPSTATPVDRTA